MVALGLLSLAFIVALAIADPVCTHCTMAIAHRAMLGATYLACGWIFAGALYCWDYRKTIANKLKRWETSFRIHSVTTKKVKT